MNELLKPFITKAISFEIKTNENNLKDLKLLELIFYRKDDLLIKKIEINNDLKSSINIQKYLNFKIIQINIEDQFNVFDYLLDEEFELSEIKFNKNISYEILKDTLIFTDFNFGGIKLNNENLKEIFIYGNYENDKKGIVTDFLVGLFEKNEDKVPNEVICYAHRESKLYNGVYCLEDYNDYDEVILLKLDKISKKINNIKVFLKIYLAEQNNLNFGLIPNSFLKFSFKDGTESETLILDDAPDFKTSYFYEVCNFQREDDGDFRLQRSFKKADVIIN